MEQISRIHARLPKKTKTFQHPNKRNESSQTFCFLRRSTRCRLVAKYFPRRREGRGQGRRRADWPGPTLVEMRARHLMHFFMRTLHGTHTVRCPHGRNTTSAPASEHTMHSASSPLLLVPLHSDDMDKSSDLWLHTSHATPKFVRVVVTAVDSSSKGRGFESHPPRCPLQQAAHAVQYNKWYCSVSVMVNRHTARYVDTDWGPQNRRQAPPSVAHKDLCQYNHKLIAKVGWQVVLFHSDWMCRKIRNRTFINQSIDRSR